MERLTSIKTNIFTIAATVGTLVINALGGWDMSLNTLIGFMVVDYILGIIVAGVFKKSPKTETGALNSKVGSKGLIKKGVKLAVVYIAVQLDLLLNTGGVGRYATIIGFILDDLVSITENIGLMGIRLPNYIVQALDLLRKKEEQAVIIDDKRK